MTARDDGPAPRTRLFSLDRALRAGWPVVTAIWLVLGGLAIAGHADPGAAIGAAILLSLVSLALMAPLLRNLAAARAYAAVLDHLGAPAPPAMLAASGASDLAYVLRRLHDLVLDRDASLDAIRSEAGRILDALPDPILMVSRNRHVVRTNRAGRTLFGSNVVGEPLMAVLRDPALLDAVGAAIEDGRTAEIELAMAGRVARVFGVTVAPMPVRGNGGPAVMAAFHDVTAVKRTEQMRVDFVANASHEIRSPLATLVGCIETLRGPARDDIEAHEEFLKMMDDQGRRMSRLVEDLLSLSRIELNEHTQPADTVDIAELVGGVAETLDWDATAREMSIRLDIAGAPLLARGDRGELEQVAYNLLSNALKYGHDGTAVAITGGRLDRVPAELRMERGPVVWFAVADEGEGIAAEHIPRLTERFYRVDTARSRELGGTGLGLAIVKHVLNRHRGNLEIESTTGRGSVFTVYLPAPAGDGTDDERPPRTVAAPV